MTDQPDREIRDTDSVSVDEEISARAVTAADEIGAEEQEGS